MKMTLKEATRSAENGCIFEPSEICNVLDKLLNTKAKDLPQDLRNDLYEILSITFDWMDTFNEENFGEYMYIDILCLTDIEHDIMMQEEPDGNECIYALTDAVFTKFLKDAMPYCTWVSLFGSIDLKALLSELDRLAKAPDSSYKELMGIIERSTEEGVGYSITPKTTVAELVKQTDRVIRQFWRPWHDLERYSRNVKVGYDVMILIAFKCIKEAFPAPFAMWKAEIAKQQAQASRII